MSDGLPETNASPAPAGLLGRLRGSARARVAVVAVAALALATGVAVWRHFAVRESTDDAQIDGHVSSVAARVGGTVSAVLVADNQYVEKGTVLVAIDPTDIKVALARAQADLAENEASARAAGRTVPLTSTTATAQENAATSDSAGADARLVAARAQLREAEAREHLATADLKRLEPLIAKDEISQQQYDAATAAAASVRAAREAAQASVEAAERAGEAAKARRAQTLTSREQVEIVSARAASAVAKVEMARAALEQARLNLSYTEVRAPVSGVVSRRTVEVGQIVQPGQPLLALVSLDDIWVTANFKESQLRALRPGQRVDVAVDAYGGRSYRGRVDSVAAATGSRFSLLPPENATGNYVKVVQRVSVKIVLESGQNKDHLLRPGMSAVPTVITR